MFCRGNRPVSLPYPAYVRWHKALETQLIGHPWWGRGEQRPLFINIILYDKLNKDGSPPKRVFDLTNKAESIMDALVDYGFISDDNYNVAATLLLHFGGFRPEQGADIHMELITPQIIKMLNLPS